jgi:adenine deaminase
LTAGLYPLLEKVARDSFAVGGVLVLVADASRNLPFMIPGPSVHWEMAALVRAGLSPADVLRAATVNAATLLGDPSRGEVAAGFRADAVLLAANPLEDIAAFGRIAGVLRGGGWFPGAELDEHLKGLARSRR